MSTTRARFLVIGGFLGAGKTTALLSLARRYSELGKRVGLITNDQAAHLVDTGSLRVKGFRVEEVAGACFCCKFDELAQCAERLREEERPDVLIGEPVGSCTDLAATVVQPLQKLYGDKYEVAPYSVLVDPTRARQIVLERGFGGFSSKVAYIFLKQLEEADVICVNKIDSITGTERRRLMDALAKELPKATILAMSGLTGEGVDEWRLLLEAGGAAGRHIAEVNYDIYAEGEAELGWLNATWELNSASAFSADELVRRVVECCASKIQESDSEVAHLKAMFETQIGTPVANFVGGGSSPRLSQASGAHVTRGLLTLNARVHMDPEKLHALAGDVMTELSAEFAARAERTDSLHFRPGRPVPTHRYSATP